MNLMLFNHFRPHRLECAQAYVQSEFDNLDSPLANAGQDLWGEMQPGGRSRHTARLAGIDGLVAVTIFRPVLPVDIGRKRHMAQRLHHCKEILDWVKTQGPLPKFLPGDDLRLEFRAIAE